MLPRINGQLVGSEQEALVHTQYQACTGSNAEQASPVQQLLMLIVSVSGKQTDTRTDVMNPVNRWMRRGKDYASLPSLFQVLRQ